MGRFRNVNTDVVVSVDDSKDDRFGDGQWEPVKADTAKKSAPAKKSATKK